MPAFACISLSRRTATSTATGRLPRTGSLNVRVSWRIAHLLAVKYATVTSAESEASATRRSRILRLRRSDPAGLGWGLCSNDRVPVVRPGWDFAGGRDSKVECCEVTA